MTAHYRIRNWSDYNAALAARGSLNIWVDETVLSAWKNTEKTGKRGASNTYIDLAIETLLTLKSVYRQKLRQTIGFARSLFKLMSVELALPHFTMLSRRAHRLDSKLSVSDAKGPRHVVIDSTGVKVYGDGEWKRCDPASLCGARERAPRHLMRNCMKYVPWKDRKAVCADLKPIYQTATLAESEAALDAFAEKWDETYPAVSQVWIRNWENVIPIFNYPFAKRLRRS